VLLLVKKNAFLHIKAIITKIEEDLDHRRGILRAVLESASPLDDSFQETLKKQLIDKTGAKGVRFEPRLVPALLGGCRLRIGSELIDASLGAQLQSLRAALASGVYAGNSAGGF
jgi:F-type H+-transporting ATPase subunit delta